MIKRSRALRLGLFVAITGSFFAMPRLTASAHPTHKSPPFTLGVSNNLIGNGWREEMVCSVKAQAKASGLVKPGGVTVEENQLDTAKQISQMRDLISKGVDAIIIDPNTPTAMNGVIHEAISRGVVVVVVDQIVTTNEPYQVANDQRDYGRRGMQWLVDKLHGHGNIVILNGIKGAPANTAREQGQYDVLRRYHGIHVVATTYTNWLPATGGQQMLSLLNSGKKIDGVWTSGIDYTVVNAFKTAHKPFVPVVGADNNEFVHQLVTLRKQGLLGAAVTNPPPVGGVGAAIALRVLQGKHVVKIQLLHPKVWANDTLGGLKQLRAHYLPTRGPSYGAAWNVPGYTTYTKQQIFACSA